MMQPVVIRGDEQRLQQVIRNILVNSLRYTDAPGQVVVSLMQSDMGIKICIKDSAPGVPEEALSHLFERFYRVDGSRNRASGGSGLGLAISQGIIAAHQGNITVAHSDLGGLQVNIELPLQLDAVNEKPAKKSKKATGLTS
jgi:two-component system sensor histidine kinase BaeS